MQCAEKGAGDASRQEPAAVFIPLQAPERHSLHHPGPYHRQGQAGPCRDDPPRGHKGARHVSRGEQTSADPI